MVCCSSCGSQAAPGGKFCSSCGCIILLGTWGSSAGKTLLLRRSTSSFPTTALVSSPCPSVSSRSVSSSGSSSTVSLLQLKAEKNQRSHSSGGIETLTVVKECKEKWEAERRRVNEMEVKFRTLIEAIKEERENKKKEMETLRTDQKEMEDRAVTAESNLLRLIRAVEDTKEKFKEEVKKWEQRTQVAEKKTKQLEEKNKRLREKQKKLTSSSSKQNQHLSTRSSSSESAAALREARAKVEALEQDSRQSKSTIEELREQLSKFEENSQLELEKEVQRTRRAEEETTKVSEKLIQVLDRVQVLESQLRIEKDCSTNGILELSVLGESVKQLSEEVERLKKQNEGFRRTIEEQQFGMASNSQDQKKEVGKEEEITEWKEKEQLLISELEEAEARVLYAETQQQDLQSIVEELREQLDELKNITSSSPSSSSFPAGLLLRQLEDIQEHPSPIPSPPSTAIFFPPPPPPPFPSTKDASSCFNPSSVKSPPPPPPPTRPKDCLEVKPRVAMKMVNWSKIPNKNIPSTIFAEMDLNTTLKDLEEELRELEISFSSRVIKKETSEGDEKSSSFSTSTVTKISLLELKRQQNVSIFLNTFRGTEFEEMKEAIETLDSESLDADSTSLLLDNLPTGDEMKAINLYLRSGNGNLGNLEDLADADRFFAVIGNIPFLRERLETHLYYLTFQHKLDELLPKLKKVQEATKQVEKSRNLVKLLEVVLAIGNFMSSSRGVALGFKLETLPKLIDTKTTDNQSHLLHFLLRLCEKKFPELLTLPKELSALSEASRIHFGTLVSEALELKEGFERLETTIRRMKVRGGVGTKGTGVNSRKLGDFFTLISKSLEEFRRKSNQLLEMIKITGEQFRTLEQRFSGTVDTSKAEVPRTTPEEFFGVLHKFFEFFTKVLMDLELERVRKAREEAKRSKIQLQLFSELQKGVKLRSILKRENSVPERVVLRKIPQKKLVVDPKVQSELVKIGMFASQLSRERQEERQRRDVAARSYCCAQELKTKLQTRRPVATKLDLLISEMNPS